MSPPDFIFMLTRHDRTIADAFDRLEEVFSAGLRHIGVKDVGLPFGALERVAEAVRAKGATLYVEVVSLDASSEVASAEAALRLGADVLMGGTRPDAVLPVLAGHPIRYYPFAGRITGHPSVLEGTIEEIVENARQLAELDGIHGIDLLAYRFAGDVGDLIGRVCRACRKPIVVAGSIDRAERIDALVSGGAAAFTVGTAALDGAFPCAKALRDQLVHIQRLSHAAQTRRAALLPKSYPTKAGETV